jgi:hypothetical protein
VVIERRGTLVKPPGVRRIPKPEELAVKVMAKLAAQRRKKSAVGGHSLPDGCAHPNANQLPLKLIVSEELSCAAIFSDSQGTSGQDPNLWYGNRVEIGCRAKKFGARLLDRCTPFSAEGVLNSHGRCADAIIGWQVKPTKLIALLIFGSKLHLFGKPIRQHGRMNLRRSRTRSRTAAAAIGNSANRLVFKIDRDAVA